MKRSCICEQGLIRPSPRGLRLRKRYMRAAPSSRGCGRWTLQQTTQERATVLHRPPTCPPQHGPFTLHARKPPSATPASPIPPPRAFPLPFLPNCAAEDFALSEGMPGAIYLPFPQPTPPSDIHVGEPTYPMLFGSVEHGNVSVEDTRAEFFPRTFL